MKAKLVRDLIDSFRTVCKPPVERKESSVSVIISLATSNISRIILQRRAFAGNREAFFSHVSPNGTVGVIRLVPPYRLSHTSKLIRIYSTSREPNLCKRQGTGGKEEGRYRRRLEL